MTSPPAPKQPGRPEVTRAAAPFPSFAFLSLGSVLSLFSFLETQAWRRVFVTTGATERAEPGSVLGYAAALDGDASPWVRWLLRGTERAWRSPTDFGAAWPARSQLPRSLRKGWAQGRGVSCCLGHWHPR